MTKHDVIELLTAAERANGLEACLLVAMAEVETAFVPNRTRFEGSYKYFYQAQDNALRLGITLATEQALQAFSYGPLQIMGGVTRELGYQGDLMDLHENAALAIDYSVKHLANLRARYPNGQDWLAAYNAGSPRLGVMGQGYVNQAYVDKVLLALGRWTAPGSVLP